jgi:hypothetical protein
MIILLSGGASSEVVQVDHGDLGEIGRRTRMGALISSLGELADSRIGLAISGCRRFGSVQTYLPACVLENLVRNSDALVAVEIVVNVFPRLSCRSPVPSRRRDSS